MSEQKYPNVILVVDDDAAVVAALFRVLEREGHTCAGASNLKQAVRTIAQLGEQLALVITDLSLAGENGMDLVHHLHRREPKLPVIVLTAFGDWGNYADALNEGVVAFLSKPTSTQEILGIVRRVFNGDPPGRISGTGAETRGSRGKRGQP